MRVAFIVLVALSVLLAAGFAVDLGDPRRSEAPMMAWLWAAVAWVSASLNSVLLLVLLRFPVPLWVAAMVLSVQVGVFTWRWVVLRRSRRADAVR